MSCGIYKITNKINNNAYIGMSCDIERRWQRHKTNAYNPENQEYNKALYRAFRKYNLINFTFEIIELVESIEELPKREIYWINFYDTFKKGYNETTGGEGVIGLTGEKHHNHLLNKEDVIDIRQRWHAQKESVKEIYIDYQHKISKTGFKKIYSWQTWKEILPELNTEEARKWHRLNGEAYANKGEINGRAKLSDKQVHEARERYKHGDSIKEIYQDYKNTTITFGSFRNAVCGYNRPNI